MHGVIRRYQVDPANVDETVRRAHDGFLPLIGAAPGFVGYGIADGGGGQVATVSYFDTREQAEGSVKLGAGWIGEQLASLLTTPPAVTSGQVRVRAFKAAPAYTVIRTYRANPGDVEDIVRRAESGFVPLISTAPGFATYTILDAGDGTVVSLSGFATREQAEASVRLAADWVRQNLAPLVPNAPDVFAGSVRAARVLPVDDPLRADARHYAVVVENERVRVLRVRYGPRERSAMHSHPDPTAASSTTRSTTRAT